MSEDSEDGSFNIWFWAVLLFLVGLIWYPRAEQHEEVEQPPEPTYEERMRDMG